MDSYLQVESALLAGSAGDEIIRRSSEVQSFLRESSAFLSSGIAKALVVERSSSKSLSVGTKKAKKTRRA